MTQNKFVFFYLRNEATKHNNIIIMSHFIYTRTTEPSISSYIDVKTGLQKYRVFISFGSTDEIVVHKLSKNYNSLNEAKSFGSVLRDLLELKGNTQHTIWDSCRSLSYTQLFELIQQLHTEKLIIVGSESPLLNNSNELFFNITHSNFEEVERNAKWWDINGTAFLSNKTIADEISVSMLKNSAFELFAPKLHHNYVKRLKCAFFLDMKDYVDPTTEESYFTFKTDLMEGIFTTNEIQDCKEQFLLTLCEPRINGVYMCEGMRRIINVNSQIF